MLIVKANSFDVDTPLISLDNKVYINNLLSSVLVIRASQKPPFVKSSDSKLAGDWCRWTRWVTVQSLKCRLDTLYPPSFKKSSQKAKMPLRSYLPSFGMKMLHSRGWTTCDHVLRRVASPDDHVEPEVESEVSFRKTRGNWWEENNKEWQIM